MSMAPSSPRLPSPPPPAEIQIGPPSPSMGAQSNRQASPMEQSLIESNSRRRIHPGTKAADMAAGPPLVPLNELDSAFQLQEHLAALHYYHTNSNSTPITRTTAIQLATPPPGIDRTLWLYELCRFLISQCNTLIVGFLFDSPPCSAATCPEMRASEWQFLCAVHEQPKSCCAIDYCCHTLDWAANIVTDPKIFPSRFVVLSDVHNKGVAVKNLVNVFRRLHRIFAHAWFQHRAVFWTIEGQTGLYVFFKTVCDMYDLLPAENYKLPPEAEGLETATAVPDANGGDKKQLPMSIIKSSHHGEVGVQEEDNFQPVGRTATRRHVRASPSVGSAVTTVVEAEEEESDMTSKLRAMRISAPDTVEEEPEMADVPVIVEKEIMGDASPTEDYEPTVSAPQEVVPEKPETESGGTEKPVEPSEDEPSSAPAEFDESEEPSASARLDREPSAMEDEAVEAGGEVGKLDSKAADDASAETKEEPAENDDVSTKDFAQDLAESATKTDATEDDKKPEEAEKGSDGPKAESTEEAKET
ncbi:Mob1/phocein family protein [Colletotrichum graminicola]|uniref:Mob1/phocein family protein n=1 Tax=Colletotrichum graminicola (strain M1.001 / M2 / FGSC 10212) TaxID=645133 RepID=E3QA85_COLGM|nr:Mob1/phocein family protein [Colletotrichum graminicola M1.001]EFQ27773.1 Mob1/phocein family protein [Colletotrichum graminicola M1.001]WDK11533.1 Mob1/phocein family protein [Colletotrichum graminicola]